MSLKKNPVTEQDDLTNCQKLFESRWECRYKVLQKNGKDSRKQWVIIKKDIHNYFEIKREKDLLHYLNRFEADFPRFNEIRKFGFSYLQFFDYVGKKNLTQWVQKHKGLSSKTVKQLLANMVSSLKHLHGVGFVHTQLIPENILVGRDRFYLTNFSHAIPSLSSYETEWMPVDATYCPPERMDGQYEDASDIYTLGCTLYFALTGKHIYRLNKVKDKFDQLYAHAFHTPRKLNKLPIFWRQLIVWMTQKNPENRPGLADLEQWLVDSMVPKQIRQGMPKKPVKSFPENSLQALSGAHYLYAKFKRATLLEAQGEMKQAYQ